MTTEKFLPIEKEYRPSLVICLGLMTLLVIFMGISLCCLVRYQNIQIAELEKRVEIQDKAITAFADEVGEAWHQIDNMGGDLYDRVRDLEDKHRIEIVNIKDGRIDGLQSQINVFSQDIDYLFDLIHHHSHGDVWLEIEYIREVCESPCRRDSIITP